MPPNILELAKEEFISIPLSSTVEETLELLRTKAPKKNIFYLYVVDEKERLVGVVSIRNLIVAGKHTLVKDVYSPNPVFIRDGMPTEQAYTLFADSRFLSLPIVNEEGQMLGVLHAHELLDEFAKNTEQLFEERSRGELYELLGVKAEDATLSAFETARHRFPWLVINVFGGIISAFLIEHFGGKIPHAVTALSFIPVLLILSESIGMQTASVVISQLRHLTKERRRSVLGRELCIALLLGLFLATPFAVAVFFWKRSLLLTLSISLTIAFGPMLVTFLGYIIPQLFHKMRIDARVASGPVLLAIADSSILFIYLALSIVLAISLGG